MPVLKYWDGAAWQSLAVGSPDAWGSAWGVLVDTYTKVSSPTGVTTEVTIPGLSGLTFTAVAGRRYRIEAWVQSNNNTAEGVNIFWIKDGTTILQRFVGYAPPQATYSFTTNAVWEGTFTPGVHTINITMQGYVGTAAAD